MGDERAAKRMRCGRGGGAGLAPSAALLHSHTTTAAQRRRSVRCESTPSPSARQQPAVRWLQQPNGWKAIERKCAGDRRCCSEVMQARRSRSAGSALRGSEAAAASIGSVSEQRHNNVSKLSHVCVCVCVRIPCAFCLQSNRPLPPQSPSVLCGIQLDRPTPASPARWPFRL